MFLEETRQKKIRKLLETQETTKLGVQVTLRLGDVRFCALLLNLKFGQFCMLGSIWMTIRRRQNFH